MTTAATANAPSKTSIRTALPILLLGAAGIGLAPLFVRSKPVGPSATAAWRLLLAAPLFWSAMLYQRRRDPAMARPAGWRDYLLLVLTGGFFAADLGFWHLSLYKTSIANATLFTNCAPLFVALAGWLWLKERFNWLFVPGLLLALAGGAIMVLLNPYQQPHESPLLGDGLGLISAVFYAGYQLCVKRLRHRFSATTIMSFSAITSGMILLLAGALGREQLLPATFQAAMLLLALAVVVQIGGQGLIAHALGHLPAAFASVSLLFQVIVATAAGWIAFHEAMGPWQFAGGALLLGGIYLARRGTNAGPSGDAEAP